MLDIQRNSYHVFYSNMEGLIVLCTLIIPFGQGGQVEYFPWPF